MTTSASSTKLSGFLAPLAPERNCRVALMDGDVEYPILPRGAGIDLADLVSRQVEVTCSIQEEGGVQRLLVRSYTLQEEEDEAWLDE